MRSEKVKHDKPGRPSRIEGTVLNQKLSIRISESEHDAIQAQANALKQQVSDMIRYRLSDLLAV